MSKKLFLDQIISSLSLNNFCNQYISNSNQIVIKFLCCFLDLFFLFIQVVKKVKHKKCEAVI